MKISLLCPTRERPDWMRRMWESAQAQADDLTNLEIVYFIDNDDTASINVFNQLKSNYVKAIIMPPKSVKLTNMYNKCWEVATGEIYAPINDDFVFESKSWDTYIREAFEQIPDRIALIYGHSLEGVYHKVEKVVMGFIHKNWTDTVGRMSPPYFEYHYADVWVRRVAELIGRKVFVPEIRIIHYHAPTYGRISAQQRSSVSVEENKKIYELHSHEVEEEAEKLKKFMGGYANRN